MKQRLSNFELVRILAMWMIVFIHVEDHILSDSQIVGRPFGYVVIQALAHVAVNVFMLITGYFVVNSCRKWPHLLDLVVRTSFFALVMFLLALPFDPSAFTGMAVLRNLFAVPYGQYWFVTLYVIVYLFVPYVNHFLHAMSRSEFRGFLLLAFLVGCVWDPLFDVDGIGFGQGYRLIFFFFLYFLGAYIRLWGPIIKQQRAGVYFLSYFALAVFSAFWKLSGFNDSALRYNQALIVLMSYCLFMGFKTLPDFTSRWINWSAEGIIGVYLIHDHPAVRALLHEAPFIQGFLAAPPTSFTLRAVALSVGIFLVAFVLARVLNTLFNRYYPVVTSSVTRWYHRVRGINS